MKKFIAAALLVGLSTAAFAQSQIDASLAFQAPDLNAAKANVLAGQGDQKSKKANNLDSVLKYTYALKLDDANTLKFGAALDVYTPFFVGSTDPYKSQLAGSVAPFVQYQGYGLDVLTSFAAYQYNPTGSNIASGLSALSFYTGPYFGAGAGAKAAKDNAPFSNYVKASYKYSVDKTLAFVAGVETDTALAPVFFVLDAKPQTSVIWTFLQLDAKYNLTFANTVNSKDSSKTITKSYVEPKLTVDFSSFADVLKGLKFYTGGKLIVADTTTGAKLKGSRWDDGLNYSFSVKDVGTFAFDTYVRVGGIGPANVADDTQIDYTLKGTYTIKF